MNPKSITFIFILLLFSQCNEKEPECISLEPIPRVYTNGHEVKAVFPYPKYPHFNPNNSDEIIFINYAKKYNGFNSESVHELIKFNLKTKKKEVLAQAYFHGKPRWGKNDWIIFDADIEFDNDGPQRFDRMIRIRGNGKDFTEKPKFLKGISCVDPQWDYKGEKHICYLTHNQYLLTDTAYNILDTLESGGNEVSSWNHPKYMVSTELKSLVLSNPYDKEEKEHLYWYGDDIECRGCRGSGVDWLDEERVIWCHTSGVYVTNIITKETKMIKETCNADYLQMPTYAPDIDRVIFQRRQHERFRPDAYEGIVTRSLYIMKPNGKGGKPLEVY